MPFITPLISAQQYMEFGLGPSLVKTKDRNLSPLVNRGIGVSGHFAYEKRDRRIKQLQLDIGYSTLNNRTSSPGKIEVFSFDLAYTMLFPLHLPSGKAELFVGGTFDVFGNARTHLHYENNELSYEFGSSLAVSGQLDYPVWANDRRLLLSYRLSLPFVSYLIRPERNIPYPEKYLEDGTYNLEDTGLSGAALRSGRIVTFNKFQVVKSRMFLTYFFKKNPHALRLGYGWHFYATEHSGKATVAKHSLLCSILLNL
ncbi:hypothetical protein [Sinomicrobium weinanense]|uniref:Uncharacterized protein n=1 Tax=Sinomicrobium weinanense TaxID=2842200 RepID=A0A926Q112_9FLAO|nr:hypothetical protein [Sinomicrobium weinanense]MBC9795248.1 hypothetical protein [Sinomicrobium weinanense]MBU3125720.1 hypothetical protein [Sinomicrobium weinanense]